MNLDLPVAYAPVYRPGPLGAKHIGQFELFRPDARTGAVPFARGAALAVRRMGWPDVPVPPEAA